MEINNREVYKFKDDEGNRCLVVKFPDMDEFIRIFMNGKNPMVLTDKQAVELGKNLMLFCKNSEHHEDSCDELDCEGCK
jgi:hypothetical protein